MPSVLTFCVVSIICLLLRTTHVDVAETHTRLRAIICPLKPAVGLE